MPSGLRATEAEPSGEAKLSYLRGEAKEVMGAGAEEGIGQVSRTGESSLQRKHFIFYFQIMQL